jgi:uncharacterized protein (DUF2132 family)
MNIYIVNFKPLYWCSRENFQQRQKLRTVRHHHLHFFFLVMMKGACAVVWGQNSSLSLLKMAATIASTARTVMQQTVNVIQ